MNGVDVFEAKYPFSLVEHNYALNIQTEMPEEVKVEGLKREDLANKSPNIIKLSDKEFQHDSNVLTENWEWYTWNSVNRAYIYHLLDCSEMNAEILLTLHNYHVYEQFFKQIR